MLMSISTTNPHSINPNNNLQHIESLQKQIIKNDLNISIVGEIDTEDGLELTLKAQTNGQLYGHVSLSNYGDEIGYLTGLYTDKVPFEYRIKNLGTLLLNQAIYLAQQHNIKIIKTTATKSLFEYHPAPFYEKFGFRIDAGFHAENSIRDFFANHGNHALNMVADAEDVFQRTQEYLKVNKWDI